MTEKKHLIGLNDEAYALIVMAKAKRRAKRETCTYSSLIVQKFKGGQ